MKKEEFVALGISEELAAKAEAASLKELEGYATKEQLNTVNAENNAVLSGRLRRSWFRARTPNRLLPWRCRKRLELQSSQRTRRTRRSMRTR